MLNFWNIQRIYLLLITLWKCPIHACDMSKLCTMPPPLPPCHFHDSLYTKKSNQSIRQSLLRKVGNLLCYFILFYFNMVNKSSSAHCPCFSQQGQVKLLNLTHPTTCIHFRLFTFIINNTIWQNDLSYISHLLDTLLAGAEPWFWPRGG
jgi:hypothetical protein